MQFYEAQLELHNIIYIIRVALLKHSKNSVLLKKIIAEK